ncbi:hypothetical protein [Rhodococcus tibetensis]|uniref:DUF998 domain-containing protein n=1 Tax=Rhodococcus tibetensis TaxID=2965064 RepID=A0ABT1QK55_9NOCA|nr:hypothetical protein [Rhodococcus sp. FXJ9.536]MCQ4122023.1 hypothetical protein [Rhodococcus sp. FXJ9.536]
MTESNSTLRRSVHRLAVSAAGTVLLCALYLVKPASTALTFPEPLRSVADQVISTIDVTSVLVATVVLAVVAMLRKLSYGIGAVLALCLGANLTSAAVRAWAADAPSVLLPSGHVVAAAALYGSAILVSAPRFRPVIAGLGFALILGVAGASALVDPISVYGLVASLVVSSIWWALASTLMLYSPVAAKREELRPDTAAMAFSRHRSSLRL